MSSAPTNRKLKQASHKLSLRLRHLPRSPSRAPTPSRKKSSHHQATTTTTPSPRAPKIQTDQLPPRRAAASSSSTAPHDPPLYLARRRPAPATAVASHTSCISITAAVAVTRAIRQPIFLRICRRLLTTVVLISRSARRNGRSARQCWCGRIRNLGSFLRRGSLKGICRCRLESRLGLGVRVRVS